jgi:hypothetical protein
MKREKVGCIEIDGPAPADDMTTAVKTIDWACGFEGSNCGIISCSDCTQEAICAIALCYNSALSCNTTVLVKQALV